MLSRPRSEFELTARSSTGAGWIDAVDDALDLAGRAFEDEIVVGAEEDDPNRLGDARIEDRRRLQVGSGNDEGGWCRPEVGAVRVARHGGGANGSGGGRGPASQAPAA